MSTSKLNGRWFASVIGFAPPVRTAVGPVVQRALDGDLFEHQPLPFKRGTGWESPPAPQEPPLEWHCDICARGEGHPDAHGGRILWRVPREWGP